MNYSDGIVGGGQKRDHNMEELALGGASTNPSSFNRNLQQLHQVLVVTILNGNLQVARSYGEEYLTRTHGLEGRL